jgi:hypothetical protein
MTVSNNNSVLLTVPVAVNKNTYVFGVQSIVAGKRLKHLLYMSEAAKSPTGLDNLQGNNGIYVRIRDEKNAAIHDYIPAQMLNSNDANFFEFGNIRISWDKSEVFIADATAIPANSCVMFLAIYE